MKTLYLLIITLTLSKLVEGQILSDTSVIYPQIKSFYFQGLKDTLNNSMPIIYCENILDSTQSEYGIFSFLPKSSVDKPYIFLRSYGCKEIEIIRDYNMERLLIKIFGYFEKHAKLISYQQRINCVEKIINILKERLR